jgi:hypothetical protein
MLLNELSVVGNGKNRRNEMLGINPASEKIMKNPTSRKEVKDLEKWLNLMLEKVVFFILVDTKYNEYFFIKKIDLGREQNNRSIA